MDAGLIDTGLQVIQTLALGLLYLFLIGRWSGKLDARTVRPGQTTASILHPDSPDHTEAIARLETEMDRARERLHKLEGWRQNVATQLVYMDRDLTRLQNKVNNNDG